MARAKSTSFSGDFYFLVFTNSFSPLRLSVRGSLYILFYLYPVFMNFLLCCFSLRGYEMMWGRRFFYLSHENVFWIYVDAECNLIYALFSLVPNVMEKKKNSMVLNCLPDLLDLLYWWGGWAHNNNGIIFHENFMISYLWLVFCRSLKY